jgi:hypothetical protein
MRPSKRYIGSRGIDRVILSVFARLVLGVHGGGAAAVSSMGEGTQRAEVLDVLACSSWRAHLRIHLQL